jgi:hypothetical protein
MIWSKGTQFTCFTGTKQHDFLYWYNSTTLGRGMIWLKGTQFSCFTGTKVQILTLEKRDLVETRTVEQRVRLLALLVQRYKYWRRRRSVGWLLSELVEASLPWNFKAILLGAQALESSKIPLRRAASHSIIKSTFWSIKKKAKKSWTVLLDDQARRMQDSCPVLQHLNIFF